jgi:hypothetical protein
MRLLFSVVLMLLLWAAPAAAQQGAVGDFYFTSPLSIAAGQEHNIPVGERRLDDTAVILTAPRASIIKLMPRTEFNLSYQPEFEWFNRHKELNSWNHGATFFLSHQATARWTLSAVNQFNSTRDMTRRIGGTFLLPHGRYNENTLSLQASYDLSPVTSVKARFDNIWVKYNAARSERPIFFNSIGNMWTGTLERRLNARSKVAGHYSAAKSHALDDVDMFGHETGGFPMLHAVAGTYTVDLTPTVEAELSAGLLRSTTTSYILAGTVQKRMRSMTIAGGYNRYLAYYGSLGADIRPPLGTPVGPDPAFARGLSPTSITETATFMVTGNITRRLATEVLLMGSRSTIGGADPLHSLSSGVRLTYGITEHMAVFAAANFYGQDPNEIYGRSISRGRYVGGLQFTFSPSPDAVNRKLDQIRGDVVHQPSTGTVPGRREER